MREWLARLRNCPIAINQADANVQHYEVPAEFFAAHLGPHRKYSCCLYKTGKETLAEAERLLFFFVYTVSIFTY